MGSQFSSISELSYLANLQAKEATNNSSIENSDPLLSHILAFLFCDLFLVQELFTTHYLWAIKSHRLWSAVILCPLQNSLMKILIVLVGLHLKGLHKTPLSNQHSIPTKGQLIFYNKRSGKRKSFRRHKRLPSWGHFYSDL